MTDYNFWDKCVESSIPNHDYKRKKCPNCSAYMGLKHIQNINVFVWLCSECVQAEPYIQGGTEKKDKNGVWVYRHDICRH